MKYTLQLDLPPGTTSGRLGELLMKEGSDWMTLHWDEPTPLVSESRFIPIGSEGIRGYWSLEE